MSVFDGLEYSGPKKTPHIGDEANRPYLTKNRFLVIIGLLMFVPDSLLIYIATTLMQIKNSNEFEKNFGYFFLALACICVAFHVFYVVKVSMKIYETLPDL